MAGAGNFVGISRYITQHIGILAGADLVSLHNDGTKILPIL